MKALVETDIDSFAELGLPWAIREPVVNNVLTTQADAVREGRRTYDDALWVTVLNDDGEVVGAAMHTPPYKLFVCPIPAEMLRGLAEAVASVRPELVGVSGEKATADEFARQWQQVTGASVNAGMSSRIYSLDSVIPAAPVSGALQQAGQADHALLVDWTAAFMREAVPHEQHDAPDGLVDRALADGAYLWEVDGTPVSYAAVRPPAAGVARIGPVYTPPSRRRRGYAGACVAEVSQRTAGRRRGAVRAVHRPEQPDLERCLPAIGLPSGGRLSGVRLHVLNRPLQEPRRCQAAPMLRSLSTTGTTRHWTGRAQR